jgi:hypothetical protein
MGTAFPHHSPCGHLLPTFQHLPSRSTLRSTHRRPERLQIPTLLSTLRRRYCDFGWGRPVLALMGDSTAEDRGLPVGEGAYPYGGWVDEECVFEGAEVSEGGNCSLKLRFIED